MARAAVAAENAALNGLDGTGATNLIGFVSLHVGDPGTTGASENASSGGYVRLACTWNAGGGGNKTNSTSLTFSTLGTIAVTAFGTWTLVSAGAYSVGGLLTANVTAASITVAPGGLTISIS